MNIKRLKVPSNRATEYLKNDKELSQYWEQLNRDCYGEIIIDSDTLEHIGHVFVWHTKRDKGFIFNLEVKPQYRRQGIGWILLDDAVKKYDGIDLLVDEDNIPAIKLYEKYGFETIKTVNGQLWMKLNQIKQEGVIMFFDRLGNAVTGEPIVEEPVVESYYDPNRPVRPGFEKPEIIQEGLFDMFKPKPHKETTRPTTIEDVETMHGIVIDKDFKKFIIENPNGCKFKYPDNKIVSKEILEFIDDEGDPSICSLNQFIDANCEYDGCIEIYDYCLYIGGWIDDKALYLATNKSSCAPEGSVIFADIIENGYDYTDRIFAKSFKDLLKNANIEKDIKEYSEMDLDEMSDYIQEQFITEAAEDVNRNQFRKYVKKLMIDKNWNTYGSDKSEGSCFLYLDKDRLKPEFIKYFNRIHEILTRYKESSTPMPTNVKHELFGLLGLSDTKWDIYPNRSSIHSDEIKLAIYKSTDTKNIFDKTGYRFFHQSTVPTIDQTGLKPSLGSTHGRVVNNENTYNRIYNKPSCFFVAIQSTDVEAFYDYIVKYQQEGKYGKYIYEYKPKSSDVFYQDLFNREGHQRFGRIMAVPVFINTDKNLPVTRVDKNIATLGAKQRRDDSFVRFDIEKDKIKDKAKNRDDMRNVVDDYHFNKRELEFDKREIEAKSDSWFKINGYATPWELSKLEEARMFKDDKLYSKIRKRMEAKAYKDKLENFKQKQLKAYRNVKAKNNDRLAKYDKQQKDDEALLKRYKAFESFIDNEINNVNIFLEQSAIEDEEPFDYDVFIEAKIDAADRNELKDSCFGLVYTDENDNDDYITEANEESKKARKNAQEFMRKEYGTSHPTSMTSKQRNRMKKWLKDNDYDPKTGTIATDMEGSGGKPFRVNLETNSSAGKPIGQKSNAAFNSIPNQFYPKEKYTPAEKRAYAGGRPLMNMPKEYMKRHPSISTGISKHEEGHIADYYGKIDDIYEKRLEAGEHLTQSMKKGMDYSPTHTDMKEHIADLYSVQHNKYKDKLRFLNVILSEDIHMQRKFKANWKDLCENVYKKQSDDKPPLIDASSVETMRDSLKNLVSSTKANIKTYKAQLKTPLYQSGKNLFNRLIDSAKDSCNEYEKILRKWFIGKLLFKKVNYDDAKVMVDKAVWNAAKIAVDEAIRQSDGDIEIRKEFLKKYINEFAFEYDMLTTDVIQEMYQTAFEDYVFQEDFEELFDYDVFIEAKIDAADRKELDDSCFGLVYTDENGKKIRKYPLTDKDGKLDENHVRQAVRFFNHCPKEHQHQLALNILHAAHKLRLDTTKWDTVNKAAEENDED